MSLESLQSPRLRRLLAAQAARRRIRIKRAVRLMAAAKGLVYAGMVVR